MVLIMDNINMPFTEGQINPNNGKPFYKPFIEEPIDPSVQELTKSAEDKEYYVLYYNLEYEEYKWAKFVGRYDAYFGIKDILDSESIDLHSSIVLVETVGLDPISKKGKKYLNHPDNCANIIEFCHHVEKFFGNNAYSVDEYDTGPHDTELDVESVGDTIAKMFSKTPEMKESEALYNAAISQGHPLFNPTLNGETIESKEI